MQAPSKHLLWMLVGCILPVLALFLLPALGLGETASVTGFLVLMFGCHLMHMLMHRNHQRTHPQDR